MKVLKSSFAFCFYRFNKWRYDYKNYVIFILLFIMIFQYTRGIYAMSQLTGERVTPWLFTFLFCDYYVAIGVLKIFIFFGVVLLFCNAPFRDNTIIYLISRSNRLIWLVGDLIYIVLTSVIYIGSIFVINMICFLPRITFLNDWGKVIGTLAYTDAQMQYASTLVVSPLILDQYSYWEATLLTFVLSSLGCIFLGVLIYTINSLSNSYGKGISCAVFFILLSPAVNYLEKPFFSYISPMTWVSIEQLQPIKRDGAYPNLRYTIIAYLLIIMFMSLLLFFNRMKIQITSDH